MNADVKSKYDKRVSSIVNQLLDGGSDEYKERLMMCPFDLILAPIHVPMWMFRKYDDHPELNLTDIEKICLSVAIHFTKVSSPTGYMECSGLVEKYCLCDVSDVDNAFRNLLSKKLVLYKTLNPPFVLYFFNLFSRRNDFTVSPIALHTDSYDFFLVLAS